MAINSYPNLLDIYTGQRINFSKVHRKYESMQVSKVHACITARIIIVLDMQHKLRILRILISVTVNVHGSGTMQ